MSAVTAIRDLTFTVPGKPVPQGGMMAFAKGNKAFVTHKKPKELGDYRARVALAAEFAQAKCLTGPVELEASFFFDRPKSHYGTGKNAEIVKASAPTYPTGRPDIDKLERALLDALSGVCFHDDSQVVVMRSSKHYAPDHEGPATVISVWELA